MNDIALSKNKYGIFVASFQTEHGRRRVSTQCRNEQDARAFVNASKIRGLVAISKVTRLTGAVLSQILAGKTQTMLVAIDKWTHHLSTTGIKPRSINAYKVYVKAWARDMKMESAFVNQVNVENVSDWVNTADNVKCSTRKMRLACLQSFFHYCHVSGLSFCDPAALVKVNFDVMTHAQKEVKPRAPFSTEEIARLLAHVEGDSFWFVAITIALSTGLRLGDICCLEWDSIQNDCIVWTGKRDKRVTAPITDEMRVALMRVIRTESKYVFPGERAIALDITARSMLSARFRKVCDAAGVFGHSFHDLRATVATEQARDGVPKESIAKLLGHSSTATTELYIKENV